MPILNVAPKTYDSPQEKKWVISSILIKMLIYMKKIKSIKYVVLSGAFEKYLLKSKYSNKNGDILDYNSLREKLILTLSELEKNNIEPIIASSIPSYNLNVHKCLKKRTIFNSNPNKCNFKN